MVVLPGPETPRKCPKNAPKVLGHTPAFDLSSLQRIIIELPANPLQLSIITLNKGEITFDELRHSCHTLYYCCKLGGDQLCLVLK